MTTTNFMTFFSRLFELFFFLYNMCFNFSSRIMEIQQTMAERAIELLALPEDCPSYILDIGCGSGLSGEALTEQGHHWVGVDISSAMLDVAIEKEVEGDLVLNDIGQGVPFRPGSFDGAISVSAIQWLCNADKTSHSPAKRLLKFFSTLYASLNRGARAALQFYPENPKQIELITTQAMKSGFTGGLVVDFPNSTKAKKYFLVLMTGGVGLEMDLGTGVSGVTLERVKQIRQSKSVKKSRDWILEKKERRKRQGKETREATRFTGRKRPGHF
nr:EOG090X0BBW [Artemia franciscana]